MELPPAYKVYFDSDQVYTDSEGYCYKQIIIQTRGHVKNAPLFFTKFKKNDRSKKPEWVKKVLSQIWITGVGVGSHTIKIFVDRGCYPSGAWEGVEEILKEEVFSELE